MTRIMIFKEIELALSVYSEQYKSYNTYIQGIYNEFRIYV